MPAATPLDDLKRGITASPVEQLILNRWSPRAFAERPVSDEDLRTLFIAGSWAASSYNEQPWRFVLGRKDDETWKHIFGALLPLNQAWAGSAPVLYASFAKKSFTHNASPNSVALHDVGAASAVISLQATALGLHTHGMAGFDKDALRAALAVPAGFDPVACWALGYLGDPAALPEGLKEPELKPRQRKPLGDFVFAGWERPAL